MPTKNTYPLYKNENVTFVINRHFALHFSSHLRSGHYNVVWIAPYNVIVPARASIAE